MLSLNLEKETTQKVGGARGGSEKPGSIENYDWLCEDFFEVQDNESVSSSASREETLDNACYDGDIKTAMKLLS